MADLKKEMIGMCDQQHRLHHSKQKKATFIFFSLPPRSRSTEMHHDDAPSITGMADAHSNEVDVLREELAACARQSTVAEVLVSAEEDPTKRKPLTPTPFTDCTIKIEVP